MDFEECKETPRTGSCGIKDTMIKLPTRLDVLITVKLQLFKPVISPQTFPSTRTRSDEGFTSRRFKILFCLDAADVADVPSNLP